MRRDSPVRGECDLDVVTHARACVHTLTHTTTLANTYTLSRLCVVVVAMCGGGGDVWWWWRCVVVVVAMCGDGGDVW